MKKNEWKISLIKNPFYNTLVLLTKTCKLRKYNSNI